MNAVAFVELPVVEIATPDFTKNQADMVSSLRGEATVLETLGSDGKIGTTQDDRDAAQRKYAQADELEAKGPPVVVYYTSVPMRCDGKRCPQPNFLASFPETHRMLICPTCGREVITPAAFRGAP